MPGDGILADGVTRKLNPELTVAVPFLFRYAFLPILEHRRVRTDKNKNRRRFF
jgi:hypothetical protein